MAFIRGLFKFLSWICYILIIAYALIWMPNLFGYRPLVVLTGSMEPTIKTGSILYYKNVPESELKVGDAITFVLNKNYVSHRIVSIENGLYETKGDANDVADPVKIGYNDIKGRDAKITIPYAGYIIKYINEHLYLIGIVMIILISEFFLSSKKNYDINKNKKIEEVEVL